MSENVLDTLLVLFILVASLFVLCLPGSVVSWSTQKTFEGTLTKTYVDRGNTYFVITPDGGIPTIYENEDYLFFLKFNSGDLLRDLNVGQRYLFRVYGVRIQFLSTFPNIISAKPIG